MKSLPCRALGLGECQVVCLTPAQDRPQFIASTRHVSMDAVSVKSERWADGRLTLEISGVPGTAECYWFHIPAGFPCVKAEAQGAEVRTSLEDGLLTAKLFFRKKNCVLTILPQSGKGICYETV